MSSISEAKPPPRLVLFEVLGDLGTYVGEYEISESRSFDIDLSVVTEATCNKSLGSCGLPEEVVESSQWLESPPIVTTLEPPVTPTQSIDFEFTIGGDFSSLTGDFCLDVFGVLGEVVAPEGINPLPALIETPADR